MAKCQRDAVGAYPPLRFSVSSGWRVRRSAARQYRLGNNPLASWPLVGTAPSFTRSLFPQALLAEPNLVSPRLADDRGLTVFSTTGGVAALLLFSSPAGITITTVTISPASPCSGQSLYGCAASPQGKWLRQPATAAC